MDAQTKEQRTKELSLSTIQVLFLHKMLENINENLKAVEKEEGLDAKDRSFGDVVTDIMFALEYFVSQSDISEEILEKLKYNPIKED